MQLPKEKDGARRKLGALFGITSCLLTCLVKRLMNYGEFKQKNGGRCCCHCVLVAAPLKQRDCRSPYSSFMLLEASEKGGGHGGGAGVSASR